MRGIQHTWENKKSINILEGKSERKEESLVRCRHIWKVKKRFKMSLRIGEFEVVK
jgi:hypothetical protein